MWLKTDPVLGDDGQGCRGQKDKAPEATVRNKQDGQWLETCCQGSELPELCKELRLGFGWGANST